MRVFLIIDETNFYQPDFVARLLESKGHDFVGCALVVKVPRKNNIEKHMLRNFRYLTLSELMKLSLRKAKFCLYNWFGIGRPNRFYSVRSVLEHYNISYFTVKNDINKKEYLNRIRHFSPEVILSSNSLYFKRELLSIPRYCINRHSSLLPSYGGLWPVFQAVRNKEKDVGVSVHLMSGKIDEGIVLAQTKIAVSEHDTVDTLYRKCFGVSASVCLDALNMLSNAKKTDRYSGTTGHESSYYGFPTAAHWADFRKNGKRFI